MTPLTQQVTSLKWSRTLEALGVPQDSYFVWSEPRPDKAKTTADKRGVENCKPEIFPRSLENRWGRCFEEYAAYTVAELGEIFKVLSNDESGAWTEWNYVYKKWQCFSQDRNCEEIWRTDGDTEANARAAMLEYLIKNNLITL